MRYGKCESINRWIQFGGFTVKFKGRDAQYFLDCCVLYVAEHGGLTSKSLWDIHKNHGMSKTLPKEYSVPVFLRMSPYFKMGDLL